MSAVIISIGILSHIIFVARIIPPFTPPKNNFDVLVNIGSSFGAIFFWVSFARWAFS